MALVLNLLSRGGDVTAFPTSADCVTTCLHSSKGTVPFHLDTYVKMWNSDKPQARILHSPAGRDQATFASLEHARILVGGE